MPIDRVTAMMVHALPGFLDAAYLPCADTVNSSTDRHRPCFAGIADGMPSARLYHLCPLSALPTFLSLATLVAVTAAVLVVVRPAVVAALIPPSQKMSSLETNPQLPPARRASRSG